VGAIVAIARLTLSGYGGSTVAAPDGFVGVAEPGDGANLGGPSMSKLSSSQLLRRHVTPFVVTFASLTLLLLGNQALRLFPRLSAQGAPDGTVGEVLVLSLPHTVALTIPMAVLVAVLWVFTRLGKEGVLAAAQLERTGVRRLLAPVFAAAAVIGVLTFVSNTLVLPRTNTRLAAVLAGAPLREPTDRTMTIGELQEAAQSARSEAGPGAAAAAAAYEVEIHKKFALAAACMVLALAGAAIPLRIRRGGVGLVFAASIIVFTGYYVSFIAGESLAERLVISPLVAMWMANAFLVGIVLLLVWRPRGPRAANGGESLAVGS
jgi:lipopolysaccharide export LptBFGC system permease protein LptF